MVPLLALIVVLALLGALAFALFGGDPPADDRANGSPTRSVSPSPTDSPSPSPSTTPSVVPVDSVDAAAEALRTVVADGVAEGRISSKAEEEIEKKLDEALEKFAEDDTEKALEELDDLVEKVEDLYQDEEIQQPYEQRIDRAIEDLAVQIELASPSDEDD